MWYLFLNYFFLIFHTAFTLFNIFGWIWRQTRKWHLVALFLTAISWFGLGIWYGWGYCFCTDWHYVVRKRLGYHNQPDSYIQFLLQKTTGINFDKQLVENATVIVFVISLVLSLIFNWKDYYKKTNKSIKKAA